MNDLIHSYCGSIWHHGIKGQKWGIRRSPEELGHYSEDINPIVKYSKSAIIRDGVIQSAKGFLCAEKKLTEFCLKPGGKHAQEFFKLGYKETDEGLLFSHLERGFDLSKREKVEKTVVGATKFSIPMVFGVTKEKLFTTGWQIDTDGSEPRFVTAYPDRRLKGDD